MISAVLSVIIRGNQLLTIRRRTSLGNQLPCAGVENGNTIEDTIKNKIFHKLGIEQSKTIIVPSNISRYGKKFSVVMIELAKEEYELNPDDGVEYQWIDFDNLEELNFIEINAIMACIEHCILLKYETNEIKILRDELSRRFNNKNRLSKAIQKSNNDSIDNQFNIHMKSRVIISSIVLGLVFSYFFFSFVGISALIFNIVVFLVFFVCNGAKNNNSKMAYFFAICSLILSSSYSIYTNPIFRTINFLLIPVITTASLIMFTYEDKQITLSSIFTEIINKIFKGSTVNSIKLPKFLLEGLSNNDNKKNDDVIRDVRNGILISIPLLFFLVLVLSGADNIFAYYTKNISRSIFDLNIGLSLRKVIVAVIVAFYAFGFTWSFKYSINENTNHRHSKATIEPITIITVLLLVCMVYMVFTKIQVTYLYGGSHKILPGGTNYAEYARKGFFQLVFIALLNIITVEFLKINVKDSNNKLNKVLNGLYSIIIVLTLNIGCSAFYRMFLYINAFGYTRLRILVLAFIMLLGIIMIFQFCFVWRDVNMLKPIIIISLLLYIGMSFFNIDAFIVNKNIQGFNDTNQIDNNYLTVLSLDAIDEMNRAYKDGKIDNRTYLNWKSSSNVKTNRWFEYNYFINKANEEYY